jgi:hypothetical protein
LSSISNSNCNEAAPETAAADKSVRASLTISQHNALAGFVRITTVSAKVASTRFPSQDCERSWQSQQLNARHKGDRCGCIVNAFSVAIKL